MDPNITTQTIANNYVYHLKNREFEIDYWNEKYIASADFARLAADNGAIIRTIPLEIKLASGRSPKRSYFYLLWGEWYSMIDFEHSKYKLNRDLESGEIVHNKYAPDIPIFDEIEKYVVDKAKDPGKHIFKSLDFLAETVCSEEFMNKCNDGNFRCLNFIPIEQFKFSPFWA